MLESACVCEDFKSGIQKLIHIRHFFLSALESKEVTQTGFRGLGFKILYKYMFCSVSFSLD